MRPLLITLCSAIVSLCALLVSFLLFSLLEGADPGRIIAALLWVCVSVAFAREVLKG